MSLPLYRLTPGSEPVLQKQSRRADIPRHQSGELFLKGPIPLEWLCAASQQPGKALGVGVAAWFLAGCTGKPTVSIGNELCKKFGIDRFAKRRGLDALASAGLVETQHQRGRNPRVTLRNATCSDRQGGFSPDPEK